MKSFIDRYYVIPDLTETSSLEVQEFEKLDEAIEAYKELSADKLKVLGVQNSAPKPGSLDFVHCLDGQDVLIHDYACFSGWNNPEIMAVLKELKENFSFKERRIRFITAEYEELFSIPDGESIQLRYHDGTTRTLPCRAHSDGYHFELGRWNTFHICEFAEICRKNGTVYKPASKQGEREVDTYDIYQIVHTHTVEYAFMDYETAKGRLKSDDYRLVYSGMLGKNMTLDMLFYLHNMDNRPLTRGMRSMSESDVILLHRGGKSMAYYVDTVGFEKLPDTICKELDQRRYAPEKAQPER